MKVEGKGHRKEQRIEERNENGKEKKNVEKKKYYEKEIEIRKQNKISKEEEKETIKREIEK